MLSLETFQAHRPLLFAIAYRMLGSASEAEDVVQDSYLRTTASTDPIESPKAFLSTVATRLCLDRLKSARATREQYIGPWLPEPILTDGPIETIERRESISAAFLLLLERLTPQERAAFVLHEVFDFGYDEIGTTLKTSPANCRQLVHRAKARVTGPPRFRPTPEQHQRLVNTFLTAADQGDLGGLLDVLASDVTFWGDGGGKVTTATRPVVGADRVARLMVGLARYAREQFAASSVRLTFDLLNGDLAVLLWLGEELDSIYWIEIAETGISAIRGVRNPDKLTFLKRQLGDRPASAIPTAASDRSVDESAARS